MGKHPGGDDFILKKVSERKENILKILLLGSDRGEGGVVKLGILVPSLPDI